MLADSGVSTASYILSACLRKRQTYCNVMSRQLYTWSAVFVTVLQSRLTFVISWNLMGRMLPDPAMIATAPAASYTTIRDSCQQMGRE